MWYINHWVKHCLRPRYICVNEVFVTTQTKVKIHCTILKRNEKNLCTRSSNAAPLTTKLFPPSVFSFPNNLTTVGIDENKVPCQTTSLDSCPNRPASMVQPVGNCSVHIMQSWHHPTLFVFSVPSYIWRRTCPSFLANEKAAYEKTSRTGRKWY